MDEAAQYRDLYNELLEENRLLIVREELAAEEAERLGHQNAELVGHANGDQKISYVDGLRREMALVKHVSGASSAFRQVARFGRSW